MPKAPVKTRKYIKAKGRAKPVALVAKVDKRARFSDDLKARAVALAREGKVTREIGTELGLDKAQWQNIRLWTERANVDLPKERKRTSRRDQPAPRPAAGAALSRKAKAVPSEPADPISRILELIENPAEAIATLEAERTKATQRLATIDKLLAVLRSGE